MPTTAPPKTQTSTIIATAQALTLHTSACTLWTDVGNLPVGVHGLHTACSGRDHSGRGNCRFCSYRTPGRTPRHAGIAQRRERRADDCLRGGDEPRLSVQRVFATPEERRAGGDGGDQVT